MPPHFSVLSASSPSNRPPAQKMDRMYRWTRHVYDLTRRYYLLGRDRLLDRVADRPAGHVLEIGCGTARNLRVLHDKAPQHTLYGVDASREMLSTAQRSLSRAGCAGAVTLGQGLAEEFEPATQLGVDRPFDVIFFSYVLSMIPSWPAALGTALSHLAPDGRLYIVDFWDQARLPDWFAGFLRRWLALFDVTPRPGILRTLRALDGQGALSCSADAVARRYAYLITVAPASAEVRGSLGQTLVKTAADDSSVPTPPSDASLVPSS